MIKQRGHFRPIKIQIEDVLKLADQHMKTIDIAKEVGCSQGYVSKVLNDNERGRRKTPNFFASDNAAVVIDYICTNGGTLKQALEHLQLKVCAETVRRLARKLGIDIYSYRYFSKRNGVWVVNKAGYKTHCPKPADYLLPVACTHCGYETELLHRNMFKEKPKPCPQCGSV